MHKPPKVLLRDVTAELNRSLAAKLTLVGVGQPLDLTSGAVGAATAVFGVLATAASTCGEAQRREMRKTEQLLRDLHDDLNAMSDIIDAHCVLLNEICELAGPYLTGMQDKMEKYVTDGKPATFLQGRVLKAAKKLERSCSEVLEPGALARIRKYIQHLWAQPIRNSALHELLYHPSYVTEFIAPNCIVE